MRKKALGILMVCSLSAGFPVLCEAQDAKNIWKNVLRNCAGNDTLGNDLLYVGPANVVGLGSIWRKSGGGYRLVWRFEDSGASEASRNKVIQPGNASNDCKGKASATTKFKPSLVLQSVLAPLSGSINVDLQKARSVDVGVDAWTMDQLVDGPYHDLVVSLPAAGYRKDVTTGLVAGKIIRVHNLHADFAYNTQNSADLSAKYKAPTPVEGGLKAEWGKDNKLHLTSEKDMVLMIELYRYDTAGFQSVGHTTYLKKEPVAPTAEAYKKQ